MENPPILTPLDDIQLSQPPDSARSNQPLLTPNAEMR